MVSFDIDLEDKTVLVTGAAGLLRSNLIKRLFQYPLPCKSKYGVSIREEKH